MASVTIDTIGAFSADTAKNITFTVINNAETITSNILAVYDSSNTVAYTNTVTSSQFTNSIPANTLTNNNSYYAEIQIYSGSTLVATSNRVLFWVVATPTISFTAPTSTTTISAHNYTTSITYTSASVTNVPYNYISSYQFDLYDSNNNIVDTSGKIYGTGTQSGTSFNVSYTFSELTRGSVYHIGCTITTSLDMVISATSANITVDSSVATLAAPIMEVVPKYGYVQAYISGATWADVQTFLLKRQAVGDTKWITVGQYTPASASNTYTFYIRDYGALNNTPYKYKVVPVVSNIEADGATSVIVSPKWDGVYICDADSSMRLDAQVAYGSVQTVQLTGVHETIGNQYPFIVANANIKYKTGSVSGLIMDDDFTLDRNAMVAKREAYESFLTNRNPKIIKDFNGNGWLVEVTDGASVDFESAWGNGIATINFNWTEVGSATNGEDLIDINFINTGIKGD